MKLSILRTANRVILSLALVIPSSLPANHPVLVEGNCNNPPANSSRATPGNCGDYDGDGLVGQDEDLDGDRVFGSITAANSSVGAGNNGTITIVTSGTFAEAIQLTGNITLEAAPGVSANIDAVLQGDQNSGSRQGQVGIRIDAPANRYVIVRNVTLRNWITGVGIFGDSRVLLDNVKIDHTVNWGVHALDNSKVMVHGSTINATGYRLNPCTGDFPSARTPMPGHGIEFSDSSSGALIDTIITGSFGTAVVNATDNPNGVAGENTTLFDNAQDTSGLN